MVFMVYSCITAEIGKLLELKCIKNKFANNLHTATHTIWVLVMQLHKIVHIGKCFALNCINKPSLLAFYIVYFSDLWS
jgi:hypothetical protein